MDYAKLLFNKRVFITTGSQGIGKDIALLFARHGASVALGGRNEPKLNDAYQILKQISPDSKSYVCDMGNRQNVEDTCKNILDDFGGIDVIVNTVGVNKKSMAHEYDEDVLQSLMETNYYSILRCLKAFAPGMIQRRSGSIINISSIHAVQTMPNFSLYAGTKGAMNASSRAIALDYAEYNIRVNNICPGLIMSDAMLDEVNSYPEGEKRDAFLALLVKMQPLPPGQCADISNAALYLASDMSSYVTGQTIMVDGGASIKAH